jgi:serine/threonine protein kinase
LRFDSAHSSPATWHIDSPASSTPTPTPGPLVSKSIEYDKLPIQQITGDLIREVIINQVHSLCARKKWNGKIIMPWAVCQPKTALLLYMCDELDAWPKAAQFAFMEMADNKHPFDEAALRGIVSNPAKVLEVQWRVGIMKNLLRGGGHVEFQTQDTVPLSDHGPVGPRTGSSTIKTRVKVKYRDGADARFYVRKRLEVHADRPKDKTAILNQIKTFTELDHTHIAKIVSSYCKGQVVAFITPHAEANLEEYYDQWTGFSQAPQLLGWVKDLASALAYIHDQNMAHRNIRPQKILVDQDERIFFSVFGVIHPMRQSYAQLYDSYSNEPGYIYGAPEVINRRDINIGLRNLQLADVFSLGCVFLEMVSVAKGHTVIDLKKYRSQHSQDNSFHVNIPSLYEWICKISASPHKREKQVLWSNRCLGATGRMLYEEPEKRWSMTRVKLQMGKPKEKETKNDGRLSMRRRRNSIDATANGGYLPKPTQSAYFSEMASLQSYYTDLED